MNRNNLTSQACSRREFLALSRAAALSLALSACGSAPPAPAVALTQARNVAPLRDMARRWGIHMGSAVSSILFNQPDNQEFLNIFQREFNQATIHAGLYWVDYEPVRGEESTYHKELVRRQAATLRERGIHNIRGHALVYPLYLPSWIREGVWEESINREGLIALMKEHIESQMSLLQGTATEWVVVNEPYRLHVDFLPPEEEDIFLDIIGPEYVDIAFETARNFDPSVKLILNDTFNHATDRRNGYNTAQMKQIVDRLHSKGLIDRVGLQMHLEANHLPDKQDMINTMMSYGLPIAVTELDVDIRTIAGSQEERFAVQAQIYADVLDACLRSGACTGVTLWEFGDQYSWLERSQAIGSPYADPTPFDDNLQPKPAYYALLSVLAEL
jgi:endo-1,4-beta-xylanase